MWKRLYKKICCKKAHIHHSDCVIFWVMRSYAERLYRTEAAGRKKHLQFTAVRLPCWVCMYSINPFTVGKYYTVNTRGNGETNMLNIHISDFNQSLIEPCLTELSLSLFLFSLSFPLSMSLSPHVWYVKVLFPCPGATYTQGKHRAVCVDDCQQWPFIICQASVLWGGKYTQWIMVVLVCRRNPTWQPAEGRDKIVYEEIVYHGHGKHCPSHMRRAMDVRLWRRET